MKNNIGGIPNSYLNALNQHYGLGLQPPNSVAPVLAGLNNGHYQDMLNAMQQPGFWQQNPWAQGLTPNQQSSQTGQQGTNAYNQQQQNMWQGVNTDAVSADGGMYSSHAAYQAAQNAQQQPQTTMQAKQVLAAASNSGEHNLADYEAYKKANPQDNSLPTPEQVAQAQKTLQETSYNNSPSDMNLGYSTNAAADAGVAAGSPQSGNSSDNSGGGTWQ